MQIVTTHCLAHSLTMFNASMATNAKLGPNLNRKNLTCRYTRHSAVLGSCLHSGL